LAPDGSPVEFYAVLPAFGEPELVHEAIPAGAEILELGCGAGRMTHRMLELGHPVVAVDTSPQMLAHVRGAQTVCSDIEELELGRTFPVVLLASHLVNTADARQRKAFLDTCALHVEPSGSVLIQRADPSRGWEPGGETDSTVDGVRIRHRVFSREGMVIEAAARYTIGERTWTQAYRSEMLDDEAFQRILESSGCTLAGWLDDRRTWARAKPHAEEVTPDP
jgi:SAM-dependent methyltransferase